MVSVLRPRRRGRPRGAESVALFAAAAGAFLSGCAWFPSTRPNGATATIGQEQKEWWRANKHHFPYTPGKGYFVEQAGGYFDEEGNPVPRPGSAATAGPAATAVGAAKADAEQASKGFELSDLAPSKISRTAKELVYGKPSEQEARQAFRDGEELFSARDYDAARKKFQTASVRWPDSTLDEDALFMLAECEFFSDRYAKADDAYGYLLKKYPNTEYLGKISKRRFAIGQYWQALHAQDPHWPFTPNAWDTKRPLFDTHGRSLRALESVMQTDPRGELADDAIMAVADAYFRIRHYDDADFRYKLLISDYPQSKYQYQAHQQSLKCKLLKYQGADYDGAPLEEAEELIEQMLVQFSDRLQDEKEREALLTARKEVHAQLALRDFTLAEYFAKNAHYRAARRYYHEVIEKYPHSSFAEQSRARLAEYKDKPEVAAHPLEFLTRWLPGPTATDGERVVRDPEVTSARRKY